MGTSLRKDDQALSPSLLKLRAATARTAGPTQARPQTMLTPATQLPIQGKNPGVPCPGEQPVHASPADIPLPPPPPRHPKLRLDLAAVSAAQQMSLPQAINPAAESARLEARASGHDGDKKDNSGPPEEAAPVDCGSDRSGLPLPVPTVTPQPPPCESPQVERIMPPTPLLQQVVEFATVAPNQQGFMEFRLGLSRNALGGMRIRVCAYGNRRVGLNVRCGEGDGTIHEGHLAGLIDALRQRNVEVVDTVFE
jgi:hypothetical protein